MVLQMRHLESSENGVLDAAVVPAASIALGMLHSSRDARAARDAPTMKRLALASA